MGYSYSITNKISSPLTSPFIKQGEYHFTNSEAEALVNRFTTTQTNERKLLIDTLVGSLKSDGIWSKLDVLYLTAASDSQAARQNWIADQYNLTATASPIFTQDRGYTGDGVAARLATTYRVDLGGVNFTQNNASLGAYINTNVAAAQIDIGVSNGAYIAARSSGGTTIQHRANHTVAGAQSTGGISTSVGLSSWSRSLSTEYKVYRNGSSLGTSAITSDAISSSVLNLLSNAGASGNAWSTKRIAMGFAGASLSDQEQADLYTAVLAYLQAIGAA